MDFICWQSFPDCYRIWGCAINYSKIWVKPKKDHQFMPSSGIIFYYRYSIEFTDGRTINPINASNFFFLCCLDMDSKSVQSAIDFQYTYRLFASKTIRMTVREICDSSQQSIRSMRIHFLHIKYFAYVCASLLRTGESWTNKQLYKFSFSFKWISVSVLSR